MDTAFHRVTACVPSTVIFSMYHATGSARSADGPLLWLVRRSGTQDFRIVSERLMAALTVGGVHCKRFCLRGIRIFNALHLLTRGS